MPQKNTSTKPRYPWFPLDTITPAKVRLLSYQKIPKVLLSKFIFDWQLYKEHQEQKLISFLSLRRRILKHLSQGEDFSSYQL